MAAEHHKSTTTQDAKATRVDEPFEEVPSPAVSVEQAFKNLRRERIKNLAYDAVCVATRFAAVVAVALACMYITGPPPSPRESFCDLMPKHPRCASATWISNAGGRYGVFIEKSDKEDYIGLATGNPVVASGFEVPFNIMGENKPEENTGRALRAIKGLKFVMGRPVSYTVWESLPEVYMRREAVEMRATIDIPELVFALTQAVQTLADKVDALENPAPPSDDPLSVHGGLNVASLRTGFVRGPADVKLVPCAADNKDEL